LVKDKMKAVLDIAEQLFSQKGFNQTTVSDIAKESGVHEASIYAYFDNKKNILFTLYGSYLKRAVDMLNEHYQGMKEPGPKLRKAIWHYLYDMQKNPNFAKILMTALGMNPDFLSTEYYQYQKEYTRLILATTIDGQKEGIFRDDIDPRLIRNLAMGTSAIAIIDSTVNNWSFDPNELSDSIYSLVINATAASNNEQVKAIKKPGNSRADMRKAQILETATSVFSKNGFSSSTISEIAKQAGLGDATLYEYFDSKEAILLAIADPFMNTLLSDEDIFAVGSSPVENELRVLIWRWLWLLNINEDFSRILVQELFRNVNFYSSPGHQTFQVFCKKIEELVAKGQQEGIFIENIPLPTYLHMIIGTIDQYLLSNFLLSRNPLSLGELNDIVNALIQAIKVRTTN